ncbi:MAG TPA: ABC transporter substrate binding protein [Candidatus Dormibacteraeota bacterium]|nr:ABC transporter substrate binding protein [Candidatus Dormibacteraeota bacterium]
MIRRRRSLFLAAAPLACLFLSITLQASQEVATISGVVADASGTPIPGAIVTMSGDGITTSRATTDARGRYRFPAIPPNHTCSVSAEGTGFRSLAYSGMFSEAGRTRTVNFRLKHPGDRDIVALVTRDPFPYEEFIRGFETHVGVPVRVVELDRERDAAETVRRVRAEHPDLIVGAGLRAARLIRRDVPDIPSILTLITDPRRYDLEAETIGFLINQPDSDRLFERVASVLPHLRRVGLVYQADTSSLLARDLKDSAQHRGLTVELRLCRTTGELLPALNGLRGRIDVLIAPNDDLTSTRRAQDIITSWSLKNHVPLAVPTPEWVERGALFSYGASYERLGEETSRVAQEILRGVFQPSDFKILRSREFELAVNGSTAKLLGLEIPSGLQVETTY